MYEKTKTKQKAINNPKFFKNYFIVRFKEMNKKYANVKNSKNLVRVIFLQFFPEIEKSIEF